RLLGRHLTKCDFRPAALRRLFQEVLIRVLGLRALVRDRGRDRQRHQRPRDRRGGAEHKALPHTSYSFRCSFLTLRFPRFLGQQSNVLKVQILCRLHLLRRKLTKGSACSHGTVAEPLEVSSKSSDLGCVGEWYSSCDP